MFQGNPFGMIMPERSFSSAGGYRYGFNGMEKDDEVKGSGNSLDFGARVYDARLGRWLSVDPLEIKYPYASPYSFVDNSPALFIDPNGKEIWIYDQNSGEPVLYVPNETHLMENVSQFVRETAATLDQISASGMDDKFKIVETLAKDNSHVLIKEIPWDDHQNSLPYKGGGTIEWNAAGGIVTNEEERQTPAEGLLHELGHIFYETYDPTGEVARRPSLINIQDLIKHEDDEKKKAGEYDTPSDKWIITEVEGGAGGAKRQSHSYKEEYKAESPFSTEGPTKSEVNNEE